MFLTRPAACHELAFSSMQLPSAGRQRLNVCKPQSTSGRIWPILWRDWSLQFQLPLQAFFGRRAEMLTCGLPSSRISACHVSSESVEPSRTQTSSFSGCPPENFTPWSASTEVATKPVAKLLPKVEWKFKESCGRPSLSSDSLKLQVCTATPLVGETPWMLRSSKTLNSRLYGIRPNGVWTAKPFQLPGKACRKAAGSAIAVIKTKALLSMHVLRLCPKPVQKAESFEARNHEGHEGRKGCLTGAETRLHALTSLQHPSIHTACDFISVLSLCPCQQKQRLNK